MVCSTYILTIISPSLRIIAVLMIKQLSQSGGLSSVTIWAWAHQMSRQSKWRTEALYFVGPMLILLCLQNNTAVFMAASQLSTRSTNKLNWSRIFRTALNVYWSTAKSLCRPEMRYVELQVLTERRWRRPKKKRTGSRTPPWGVIRLSWGTYLFILTQKILSMRKVAIRCIKQFRKKCPGV